MPKIKIVIDELYPYFAEGNDPHAMEIEVTTEQLERWRAAQQAFDAAQNEIAALVRAGAF